MGEQEQLIKDWLKDKHPEYTYRSHYEAIDGQGSNHIRVKCTCYGDDMLTLVSILDLIAFVYCKKC